MTHDTTPPKRIWAEETGMATKGGQRFRIGRWIIDETESHPHEYILASEVAALIAEAEARGRIAGLREAGVIAMTRRADHSTRANRMAEFDSEQAQRTAEKQGLRAEEALSIAAAIRTAKGDQT